MGVERHLVCASLRLAVAQRLVRKICPHCRETYKPDKEVLRSLGMDGKSREGILFSRRKS